LVVVVVQQVLLVVVMVVLVVAVQVAVQVSVILQDLEHPVKEIMAVLVLVHPDIILAAVVVLVL
jgi:hypothetical protein